METHVLNGDALAEKFPFSGMIIVCREALIEGPVGSGALATFWDERAKYLSDSLQEEKEKYFQKVKNEIEKLSTVEKGAEINLWFEHDLFCQVNMWFILHLIRLFNLQNPVYRVQPPVRAENIWAGFGGLSSEQLKMCFAKRVRFPDADLDLGTRLWLAYSQNDIPSLKNLSTSSEIFPCLQEVVNAHVERVDFSGGRPKQRLRQILAAGKTDFNSIFSEFSKTEGIYGFGDHQVKNMLSDIQR
jgi:hypothetical protein